jgi:hypothetical protein
MSSVRRASANLDRLEWQDVCILYDDLKNEPEIKTETLKAYCTFPCAHCCLISASTFPNADHQA